MIQQELEVGKPVAQLEEMLRPLSVIGTGPQSHYTIGEAGHNQLSRDCACMRRGCAHLSDMGLSFNKDNLTISVDAERIPLGPPRWPKLRKFWAKSRKTDKLEKVAVTILCEIVLSKRRTPRDRM